MKPQRIALVGASDRLGAMGTVLYRNLRHAGFGGTLQQVNPKYTTLNGTHCFRDVSELDIAPDLAVICTPPATVPDIVRTLARRGCKAAVIITAGPPHDALGGAQDFKQLIMEAVGTYPMRIIGPNCLGIQSPIHHIDASFSHLRATPGSLAFVTQSGAMLTTVLDWAQPHGIGFSALISLGDMADIDIADLLQCLADDDDTSAILLYLEAINHGDKFMAAAKMTARSKPVVVIKAGRSPAGAHAAASHTGMLTGVDAVYDTAFRRCGILRVDNMQELFAATETLAMSKPMQGERVAILTNGGGPGVLAADALVAKRHDNEPGATLAVLQVATVNKLNAVLPPNWSHGNPVDIIGDANASRYGDAIKILMDDDGVDALLVLNCPTAMASSIEAATAVAPLLQHASKPAFTSWLGGATVHAARQMLRDHHLPSYDTPELAVEGILHRIRYHRNQQLLNENYTTDHPQLASATAMLSPSGHAVASALIDQAIRDQREWLNTIEVTQLLSAYRIPCVATALAENAEATRELVEKMGKACVIKIMSRDITHKSDVGGVKLNIVDGESAYIAAQDMLAQIHKQFPTAHIDGVIVQEMINRPQAYELVTGSHRDPAFGPVLLFGQGGVGVEIINDRALELPPLSPMLARRMIDRTRIGALLKGFRNEPAVDMDGIVDVLMKVAELMMDHSRIVEMDINPLLADPRGVLALDARIRVK